MKFSDLKIGAKFESVIIVTTENVIDFARISGDNNPLHIDDEYSQKSIFKGRIVHGMLIGSFFSKAIASDLPGPGSIYLQQTMNFLKPIYHNSTIKIVIEVKELKPEKNIVYLNTTCWIGIAQVVEGSAIVKCLE
jgi:3-hydroxybutyryl-CoA dehydratase